MCVTDGKLGSGSSILVPCCGLCSLVITISRAVVVLNLQDPAVEICYEVVFTPAIALYAWCDKRPGKDTSNVVDYSDCAGASK